MAEPTIQISLLGGWCREYQKPIFILNIDHFGIELKMLLWKVVREVI